MVAIRLLQDVTLVILSPSTVICTSAGPAGLHDRSGIGLDL
jgi:hypothetical protein